MDASNWIAVSAILANIITGVVAYLWGKRDEKLNRIVEHDRTVWARLDAALPYNDLKGFLDTLDDGYFLREAGVKVAVFQRLFREPENEFLAPTLRASSLEFFGALRTMREYVGVNFSSKDSGGDHIWLHSEKKDSARVEFLPLIEGVEKCYLNLRAAVKEELKV